MYARLPKPNYPFAFESYNNPLKLRRLMDNSCTAFKANLTEWESTHFIIEEGP